MSPDRGLRLASFDGGGPCSFSQLEIMRTIMHQVDWDLNLDGHDQDQLLPCQHFDMIGGSDTGGLIALMLVKLRLSVEDASKEFAAIVEDVYVQNLTPRDRTSRLRERMESLLMRRGFPANLRLEDGNGDCVGFVVTASSFNIANKVYMRTYRPRGEPPSTITVVEAALATCASPPEFLPVPLGPRFERQDYIGAGIGANNPTRYVLNEAAAYFGSERKISSLLSLGSGHPGVLSLAPGNGDGLYQLVQAMILDSEQEAQEICQRMAHVDIYFRFSVEQGMHRRYTRGADLGWVSAQTSAYLSQPEIMNRIDQCIARMTPVKDSVTLNQLAYSTAIIPPSREAWPFLTPNKTPPMELAQKPLNSAKRKHSEQLATAYQPQDHHPRAQPAQGDRSQERRHRRDNEKQILFDIQLASLCKHDPKTEHQQPWVKETQMQPKSNEHRGWNIWK